MLTIKRVATLVSFNQELEQATGCGRDCLGSCCMPGAKLPLYTFRRQQIANGKNNAYSNGDSHKAANGDTALHNYELHELSQGLVENSEAANGFLDSLLLAQWEDRMERGLFRYDVTACETMVLPGEHGFIAQLNEGRHSKKRPTEFRVDQVLQPYDGKKFNFTKVGQEEVLFCFEESEDGTNQYYEKAPVSESPNVIAINVSPIEYGHVLLVPRVLNCTPQRIDPDTFLLALHMAAEADNPYFRLGYNSLGAFATINHLHFQAYYLTAPFPVERAPTTPICHHCKKGGIKILELGNFPVQGLVFEIGDNLEDLANAVANACIYLQNANIPFNVLIADRGGRVFIFPQCFGEKQARGEVDQEILDTQVNPAVWEISGHIVLKRRCDYDTATEESAWRLLAEVSLTQERFNEVKKHCLTAVFEGPNKAMSMSTIASNLHPMEMNAAVLNGQAEHCLLLQA
ncbi:unnamed protein product [Sphagnum tenellum]